ncbi:ATP-binding protein [Pedobacter sp. L105]|uniref:GAF domain-containing sensor histidine kinase n=1 Tax=Pedobacter sp. L105 TaxID=1641871 RepID=UPI00131A9412|nr:ATP-binding protein [Pedobacter sp. L105]
MKNTFATEIILPNEQERLHALRSYRILGTYAEKSFKSIAKLVADIFKSSIAMISLVDAEEVYFGSNVGMDNAVGPRGESFCSLTILKPEVNVIEDALLDPVVANNPLVCGDFGLRFYAGAPLITHDGFMIGTVCLVDTKPRTFNDHDKSILEGMAGLVMEQIELRLQNLLDTERQAVVNDQLLASNEKLSASEGRFQTILDTMAEGVRIIDTSGRLVYANIMAQHLLGLTPSKIEDGVYDDPKWQLLWVNGSPLPEEDHPMAIMMRTGQPVLDYEVALQPPGRERFYISVNAAPIFDRQSGELTGGIGTFMDVTNRRKVLQQKDEFINVASHELRTPVTSLKAAMQIMDRIKDNPKPDVLAKMIDQSNKSLSRLTSLITDLLDSNRISQGQLHLRKTKFNLSSILESQHIRDAEKHEIIIEGIIDMEIEADEQQIDQVLVNLLSNAVKYAPESKVIHVIIEHLAEQLKISVKDSGPGIAQDQLIHLFERYYRVDYSGFQYSGLGLGLYISSEIIKKHGGTIGVESVVGSGTTFWFTIPI